MKWLPINFFPGALGLVLSLALSAWPALRIAAESKAPAALPKAPGDILQKGGGWEIILEKGRVLSWPAQGPLRLRDNNGQSLATVDLTTRIQKVGGAEAMGLEVEEADLGGGGNGKTYLPGKKAPKGRRLDPNALKQGAEASDPGQSTQTVLAGIAIAQTKFANGSYSYEFDWGKTQETVFFDRRNTLIRVRQTRQVGALQYTLEQWGDGSFSRIFREKSGEVNYTYDAQDGSYRILFANPQGEIVQEISCDPNCS
jgi:hypothetical protein